MKMTTTIIWNPATYEPDNIHIPILAITGNNKLVIFKNTKTFLNGDTNNPISGFSKLVKKYNIRLWIYQNCIINDNSNDIYED